MSKASEIVDLNIGGVFYTTTMQTLTNEPNSLFTSMLDTKSVPVIRDSTNKIFIDRDGLLFRYILDYLRNRKLILADDFTDTKRLRGEAEYYILTSLMKLIDETSVNCGISSININTSNEILAANAIKKRKMSGCITVGYRGTFANSRDGLSDVKFRKISRILVCGRVQLCREVFGDTLNESRDPDHGVSDRYTSRFFLKHIFLEQAFDTLAEANFHLVCAAATGANASSERENKNSGENEENKWLHYNEYTFIRS